MDASRRALQVLWNGFFQGSYARSLFHVPDVSLDTSKQAKQCGTAARLNPAALEILDS